MSGRQIVLMKYFDRKYSTQLYQRIYTSLNNTWVWAEDASKDGLMEETLDSNEVRVWGECCECVCVRLLCCVAAVAVWERLWVSPLAKTDVSFLSPPFVSCCPPPPPGVSGRQQEYEHQMNYADSVHLHHFEVIVHDLTYFYSTTLI